MATTYACLACVALLALPLGAALGGAIGLPLLLVAPGTVLVEAFTATRNRDAAVRIVLALGTSVAVVIAGAIALDAVGIALTRGAFLLVSAISALVIYIASRLSTTRPEEVERGRRWAWTPALVLAASGAVFVVGLGILRRPLANHDIAGYTALSAVSEGGTLRLAIRSGELASRTYVVRIAANPGNVLSRTMTLVPGEHRGLTLRGARFNVRPLSVSLLAPDGSLYRQLTLR